MALKIFLKQTVFLKDHLFYTVAIFAILVDFASAETDIYFVPSDALGIMRDHPTHVDLSSCIGSISNSKEGLLAQCHSKAPDGHIENRPYSYYNRIWNKRDINKARIKTGWMWIPYQLIRTVNGQHSTYYSAGITFYSSSCPDDGCHVLSLEPDLDPPVQCEGNPVEVTGGTKFQKENDLVLPIYFSRNYRSSGQKGALGDSWSHNFDKSLEIISSHPVKPRPRALYSHPYRTRQDACIRGWLDIKSRLNNVWASEAAAEYDSTLNTCRIFYENTVVAEAQPVNTNTLFEAIRDIAELRRPNGSMLSFEKVNDEWRPLGRYEGRLITLNEGGWQFITPNGNIERYSAIGLLTSVAHIDGTLYTLNYGIKRELQSVESSRGGVLRFRYADNLISEVVAPGIEHLRLSYTGSGVLEKVIRQDGSYRRYHYGDSRFPAHLTGITNEDGEQYASWLYDNMGRAIFSGHAAGMDQYTFTFQDHSSTVTGPLGKQTTYHYEYIFGARRLTSVEGHVAANCAAANKSYDYYPNGTLKSKTDWSGNVTTYERDGFGREISRTEAAGTSDARTITTEYHPTLNLPVRIIVPGRVEVMTYDEQGRLLSKNIQPVSAPSP